MPDGGGKGTRPLRFAVMANGETVQAWQARSVTKLLSSGIGTLVGWIVNDSELRRRPLTGRFGPAFKYAAYEALSFGTRSPAAGRRVSIDRVGSAPKLRVQVEREGRYSEYFPQSAINRLRELELDMVLRFGFGIIRGDVLDVPRYGVWSFHHGDERVYRGRPAGFWEVAEDQPTTGFMLQRLTERLDGGVILDRGCVRTASTHRRNLDRVLWKSVSAPVHAALRIQSGDVSRVRSTPSETTAEIRFRPTNRETLRYLAVLAVRRLRSAVTRVTALEEWAVGIVDASRATVVERGVGPSVRWLTALSRRGSFAVDPFAFELDGDPHLLFELYSQLAGRGVIASAPVHDGEIGPPRVCIDDSAHLSYPFVFESDGRLYCVPETSAERRAILYELDRKPTWVRKVVLVEDFPAVDSTVFQYRDRWWLACTSADEGANDSLFLWYSDHLEGPWRPHRGNPVKIDVRSARPGGRTFVSGESVIRPAQDQSWTYGGGLRMMAIKELTPETFEEVEVARIKPPQTGPFRAGLHNLDEFNGKALIDARRWVVMPEMSLLRVGRAIVRRVHSAVASEEAPVSGPESR